MSIRLTSALVFMCVAIIHAIPALAIPEYAERTNQGCLICHINEDGGDLNETGLIYSASGHTWPAEGGFEVISPITNPWRSVIGFFHILSSFMWFGTIFYVHLVLRPKYAAKGLPHTEVMIGVISMLVVGVSGLVLTMAKIRGIDVLVETAWGQALALKIALYLSMLFLAGVAVTFIGPKLKREIKSGATPVDDIYDPATLSAFNGKDGRLAFIAYKGNVYDVTSLGKWKGGKHFRHLAGEDQTQALSAAPHGEEMLERAKVVGSFDLKKQPALTGPQRAFYVIAYTNLTLALLTLAVLSHWIWGT